MDSCQQSVECLCLLTPRVVSQSWVTAVLYHAVIRRVGTARALKYEDGGASSVSQAGEAIWDNACWPGNYPVFPGSKQRGRTLPTTLVKARNVSGKTKALLNALAQKIL